MNTYSEMSYEALLKAESECDETLSKLKLQAARGLDVTNAMVDAAGMRKAITEELVERQFIKEKEQEQKRQEAEEEYFRDVAEKAGEIEKFEVSMLTDNISRVWLWGAIYQNLQFQAVSTEGYLENLYIRRNNEVQMDGSMQTMDTGQEGVVSTENMIQSAEQKLDELNILRFVAEREYDKNVAIVIHEQPNATWIPKLKNKTDEQLRLDGAVRQEQKLAAQREAREKEGAMLAGYKYARRL